MIPHITLKIESAKLVIGGVRYHYISDELRKRAVAKRAAKS